MNCRQGYIQPTVWVGRSGFETEVDLEDECKFFSISKFVVSTMTLDLSGRDTDYQIFRENAWRRFLKTMDHFLPLHKPIETLEKK